jgi:ATP-binding cassette subfamily G (WHITE) protein 2 (PDR)
MSLVGNFAFGPGDRTAENTGTGTTGTPFVRRASQTDQDPESTAHAIIRRSSSWARLPSIRGRRPSAAQTEHANLHAREQERPASPSELEIEKSADAYDTSNESTDEKHRESDDSSSQEHSDKAITQLARSLTQASKWSQVPSNPFCAEAGSELDPSSPNFRARAWTKSMIKLSREDGRTPVRTGGVAFRGLNAHGFGAATDYQKDVGNVWLEAIGFVKKALGMAKPRRIDILRDLDGLVESGDMLVVLGPPGSGCSTFLKTLTGEIHGFEVDSNSYLNYQGIPANEMHKYFRGEAIYTAEVDVHFPMMTVGDTLTFAARARAPRMIPGGVSRNEWAQHLRDVVMATFGISHTVNTRVGNDFVRGVSGGERKRVSIAEAALSGAPLQAWDNSTRKS